MTYSPCDIVFGSDSSRIEEGLAEFSQNGHDGRTSESWKSMQISSELSNGKWDFTQKKGKITQRPRFSSFMYDSVRPLAKICIKMEKMGNLKIRYFPPLSPSLLE